MKDTRMAADYSDETLMAFADGLLDEPLFSAVAEAVEHDGVLAERLAQLVDGAALARQGLAPLLQPVSPELEASVRAMIDRRDRQWHWTGKIGWPWLLPLAGAVGAFAAIAVALPMLQPTTGTPDGLEPAGLQVALDSTPSGGDHLLPDGRQLHAVASFTDGSGTLCREFEVPGYVMVACRDRGRWQIALAVAKGPTEGYQTASGLAVLDSYLGEIGASAPLLEEAERSALARP